ncbi:NIPSNAP family protein [Xanthobacter dioxanivorans]|uniref:NIPSNAP family protein n=1 Tax=Xanthobacter dioxanivorans TaxID=2528964 RepID=A0A974SLG9_9HYPH|nr:NIPSNAP family protein [Xanthobacter dioxanivorans]QRG09324.1 NIPSNAP family protein [Xanthobacter dioxanivorans]
MIVEERIYVLHTHASMKEYLNIYSTEGLPVQKEILGGFLGYFTTEIGVQNQLVHLWAYDDLEERRKRREKLAEQPAWQSCLLKIRPMIMTMENRILIPTAFSPLPGSVLGAST